MKGSVTNTFSSCFTVDFTVLVGKYGLFIVAFKLIANENMPLARFSFNKPFCFTVSLCVDSLDLKLNPQLSKIKF